MHDRPRLLDQVRDRVRVKHYSIRTEQAYVEWVRRFVVFSGLRHPRELGQTEVGAFLTHLAVAGRVSASTHNQAKSALLFLYKEVLGVELPWLDGIESAKRPARLPVVLTTGEVEAVLALVGGTPGVILRRVLERHGLLGYFGAISYSDEVGFRKPEARIFHVTLERAGMVPDDALHIGDNPDADVAGAHGVGMRAAHYTAGFRRPSAEADLLIPDLAMLADAVFRIAPRQPGG